MASQLPFERLLLARQILTDVPEEAIDLDIYYSRALDGTVKACGAGHLAMSKEFNAFGFRLQASLFNAESLVPTTQPDIPSTDAINYIFDDGQAFRKYFTLAGTGIWDAEFLQKWNRNSRDPMPMSHKELLLARINKGLENEAA